VDHETEVERTMMNKLAFAACAALVAAAASASPLLPGGVTFPASPEVDGAVGPLVQVATLTSNFNDVNNNYTGSVISTVYTNDPTNPFGPNAYTFTYIVNNDATSTDGLGRFTALGFAGLLTDVSFCPLFPLIGTAPFQQDRQVSDEIGWSFANIPIAGGFPSSQILPGTNSYMLVVQVPVDFYHVSTGNVIDGSIATMEILAPIPTPSAGALIGLGLLASARRRTR
jgi:hypothetical protein